MVIPRGKIIAYFFNKLKTGLQKQLAVIPLIFCSVIFKLVKELTSNRYIYCYFIKNNVIYVYPKYLVFRTNNSCSIKPALLRFNVGSTSAKRHFADIKTIKRMLVRYPTTIYVFETRIGYLTGKEMLQNNIGGKLIFYFQ